MKPYREYEDVLSEELQRPKEAFGYLNEALADEDLDIFLLALKDVAKAKLGGIAELADETSLSRETLYRTLSLSGNPRFSTLNAILDALGYRISIEPKTKKKKRVSKKITRGRKATRKVTRKKIIRRRKSKT